ncbi:MAG: glycosyltransferase [Candidatus Methylumidiphilus sp.]
MKMAIWRWHLHRFLLDKTSLLWPFSTSKEKRRLLFIGERDPICHTQWFPYFFHSQDLAKRYGMEIRELPMARFNEGRHPYRVPVDAVCFQTWFDLGPEAIEALVRKIRETWPDARIAYFDWFAPTDLRYAGVLDQCVEAYVKKQALRDFSQYSQPTLGDTNLTDYYARRFQLDYPETRFQVPDNFRDKLLVGTHFAFSDHMLPYFLSPFPQQGNRSIDLHARIAVKGTEWYTRMRQEALDKVTHLEGRLNVVCRGRVSRDEYFKELFNSKLCFSPFGYGEVCWRDFEAMFTGSLLLKPDMSHLDCYPEVFLPYETYIPLAWDLSDFDEKVDYYLNHPAEREAIARKAFELLSVYFRQQRFPDDMKPLLRRLGLEQTP